MYITHLIGKYLFNTMPGIGECTGGKIESKMDIVMMLTVFPEGHITKHATTTKCGKSYHKGKSVHGNGT